MLLKPEEHLRQAFKNYLIEIIKVPPQCIEIEVPLSLFEPKNTKRCDLLVFKKEPQGKLAPWLLAEFKAPRHSLTSRIELQVGNYLTVLKAEFLVLSNGNQTLFYQQVNDKYLPIPCLPLFRSGQFSGK